MTSARANNVYNIVSYHAHHIVIKYIMESAVVKTDLRLMPRSRTELYPVRSVHSSCYSWRQSRSRSSSRELRDDARAGPCDARRWPRSNARTPDGRTAVRCRHHGYIAPGRAAVVPVRRPGQDESAAAEVTPGDRRSDGSSPRARFAAGRTVDLTTKASRFRLDYTSYRLETRNVCNRTQNWRVIWN